MLFYTLVALSAAYFLLGLLSRRAALRANPCGMTFTMRDRQDIRVASSSNSSSFRLIKYSLPKSQRLLNAYPVLFVPGHLGDADQARSLASYMHNGDNFFQYFSLDFGRSLSGAHGAYVLHQAVFLNEALQAIRELYRKKTVKDGKSDDWNDHFLKVIIVGHSLGGLVARTALLLDNHPRGCLVSDIIMLSSPNVAAPFGPDVSLELLFRAVNKDWSGAFLRTGGATCRSARRARGGGSQAPASWNSCSNCTAQTRVVSITGGDIDLLVHPLLTRLDVITPSPRNLTHEARTGGLKRESGLVQGLRSAISRALSLVSPYALITEGAKAASSVARLLGMLPPAAGNATDAAGSRSEPLADIALDDLAQQQQQHRENKIRNSSYRAYENVTAQVWEQHMQPYLEPQHISLRASQLVGHPVDHLAILWCKELLQPLTKAMRVLAVNPAGGVDVLTQLFPDLRSPAVPSPALSEVQAELLPPLFAHLLRGESAAHWAAAAAADAQLLAGAPGPLSALRASAALFVSAQLYRVAVCYAALSALLLTTPLVRRLAGRRREACLLGDWQLLRPGAHLHLDLLLPQLLALLRAAVPQDLHSYLFSYRFLVAMLVPLLSKVWWDVARSPGSSPFGPYDDSVLWLVAYCLAICARAAVLALLYSLRGAAGLLRSITAGVVRATVWSRPVRRLFRRAARALPPALRRLCTSPLLLCAAAVAAALYATRERALPSDVHVASVLSLVLSALASLLLLLDLLAPPNDAEAYHGSTQLLMFYLPLPLLCLPSAMYAAQLLDASDSSGLASSLAVAGDLFGPERANFCFCLLAVVAQLLSARSGDYYSTEGVEEITWLAELLGPDEQQQQLPSGGACLHEEGGSRAVYEEIEGEPLAREVTAGVVLGPTYRVVSCSCSSDASLKAAQWCEWCSCRRCGGAQLPRGGRGRTEGAQRDFSAPLGLALGLHVIAALCFYYAGGAAFRFLHLQGLAAILFLVRDYFGRRAARTVESR